MRATFTLKVILLSLLAILSFDSNCSWFPFVWNKATDTDSNLVAKEPPVYFVILAGGKGERLWPLSREDMPKQFIPFKGKSCLLEETVSRVETMVPGKNIMVVTNEKYKESVSNVVGKRVGKIIAEPAIRNTAPAIALSCLEIAAQDPDAVVVFLPADHYIHEKYLFLDGLEKSINFSREENGIVLFGITPTYPATGYGYIEFEQPFERNKPAKIIQFREKPNLETAEDFLSKSNFLWNAGIFCGKVQTFVDAFEKYDNEVLQDIKEYMAGTKEYKDVKAISVDYAIMEKSKNIYVLPLSITWLDVGSIDAFLKLKDRASKVKDNVITHNSSGNLVDANGKLAVLIGVNDLCIVDTSDVLLVVRKDESQAIKSVLASLKEADKIDYL
ncbi:mannose-1-phosphate guanylyltransferase [bacterium]|jgi:mannose-1-phosphate guanylyltransferase|nr:mannose-1-phosphate guanylyltransferase [bacterium]